MSDKEWFNKELDFIINNDHYVLRPDDEQSYIDEFVNEELMFIGEYFV